MVLNHSQRKLLFFSLSVLFLSIGCSGKFKSKIDFDPQEPLRVAILPFVILDDKGKITNEEGRLLVDNLSLISKDLEQTPAQIVRKQVLIQLKQTDLDLLSTALIDIDLPHNGFATSDGKLNLEKLYQTSPQVLCTKFINCDAVLYGKITNWDRSYFGIQSVNTVGIDLQLVSAKTGKILFSSEAKDSESRGLSKGPTGYFSIVVEPIKGLDSQVIVDLSRKVVAKMLEPLDSKNKPEFLATEPPSIFAASHDAASGVIKKQLIVVMMGTPQQAASFSIGQTIKNIPMFERSPGNYYGEYIPWEGEHFSEKDVFVYLKDKFGRTTQRKIILPQVNL
jgi:hypothetical protein